MPAAPVAGAASWLAAIGAGGGAPGVAVELLAGVNNLGLGTTVVFTVSPPAQASSTEIVERTPAARANQ